MSKDKILQLREDSDGLILMYVEDSKKLQEQALKIFSRIFSKIFVCADGQEGLNVFKRESPNIVITDINMPIMNGIEMAKRIKKIEPFTKIIITSAYDDKEYLLGAIEANVSKYLKKPISALELIDSISKIVDEINFEKSKDLFEHYVKDVFQYQESMLILLKGKEVLIVNKRCLEFFSQESLKSFKDFFLNFNNLFLKHNNFLYSDNGTNPIEIAKGANGKLFNVKMSDKDNNSRHFILKAYKIPKKDDTYILSFDDITELNLLVVYDKSAMQKEKLENQRKIIFNIFEIIKRNNSNIRIYNSYKGLSISNIGVLLEVSEEKVVIQTQYLQQRAIKINNYLIIESELLPMAVFCEIRGVDFENGNVVLQSYKFIDHKPSEQEHIRVGPEENHKITLFFDGRKITVDSKLVDVSVGGAKIVLSFLPADFKGGDEIIVDIVFYMEKKPIIINTKAKVKSIVEQKREFEVIVIFEENFGIKKLLTEYVANRQMALIREYKKL